MKKLMSLLFVLGILAVANAQPEKRFEGNKEEMQAKKVAYISTQLALNTEEAQKFWPVYNEYQAELEGLRKEQMENFKVVMEAQKNGVKMTDPEIEKVMASRFAIQSKLLDLDKKYYEKFKKVIPLEKVAKYYVAEERFKVEMLREMRDRPQPHHRK